MNGFTSFEWTYRRPPGRFVQNKMMLQNSVTLLTILKKFIHRFPITWFNFTCNHTPHPGTPLGICYLVFLSWRSIPHPRARRLKETIPHPRAPDWPHIHFLVHLFWSVQKKSETFSQLLETFSWVYWEKDNGCHNVAKTWRINLKTKRKTLQKAPPW